MIAVHVPFKVHLQRPNFEIEAAMEVVLRLVQCLAC